MCGGLPTRAWFGRSRARRTVQEVRLQPFGQQARDGARVYLPVQEDRVSPAQARLAQIPHTSRAGPMHRLRLHGRARPRPRAWAVDGRPSSPARRNTRGAASARNGGGEGAPGRVPLKASARAERLAAVNQKRTQRVRQQASQCHDCARGICAHSTTQAAAAADAGGASSASASGGILRAARHNRPAKLSANADRTVRDVQPPRVAQLAAPDLRIARTVHHMHVAARRHPAARVTFHHCQFGGESNVAKPGRPLVPAVRLSTAAAGVRGARCRGFRATGTPDARASLLPLGPGFNSRSLPTGTSDRATCASSAHALGLTLSPGFASGTGVRPWDGAWAFRLGGGACRSAAQSGMPPFRIPLCASEWWHPSRGSCRSALLCKEYFAFPLN